MAYILRSAALTYGDGQRLDAHSHSWGQLIYAATGTMRVHTENAMWLVPPGRALWAPPEVTHAIEMRGSVAMRTVYVPPERAATLPAICQAVEIAALLRELILHIVSLRLLDAQKPEHLHIAEVFFDQLQRAERVVLHLPMPRNERLRRAAERLRDGTAGDASLARFAREANLSMRTLQRRFRRETGMRFVEWRQRLRLIQAIAQLSSGATVTEAGAEAGYASTSAFSAAFRSHMGATPNSFRRSLV